MLRLFKNLIYSFIGFFVSEDNNLCFLTSVVTVEAFGKKSFNCFRFAISKQQEVFLVFVAFVTYTAISTCQWRHFLQLLYSTRQHNHQCNEEANKENLSTSRLRWDVSITSCSEANNCVVEQVVEFQNVQSAWIVLPVWIEGQLFCYQGSSVVSILNSQHAGRKDENNGNWFKHQSEDGTTKWHVAAFQYFFNSWNWKYSYYFYEF